MSKRSAGHKDMVMEMAPEIIIIIYAIYRQSSTPSRPPPTVPRDSPSTCLMELEAFMESLDMTLSMCVEPNKPSHY